MDLIRVPLQHEAYGAGLLEPDCNCFLNQIGKNHKEKLERKNTVEGTKEVLGKFSKG